MLLLLCLSAILGLIFVWYSYTMKTKYTYWSKKGVKGPPPIPIFGNFKDVITLRTSIAELTGNIYHQYPEEKIVGMYRGFKPVLVVRDTEIIKHILVKDFSVFAERGLNTSRFKSRSPLANNLFNAEGETWEVLRQKLSPIFTSKKIKDMIPLMQACIDDYTNYINEQIVNKSDHNVKTFNAKFTMQVICSCAFGLEVDTYSTDDNKFVRIAKDVFNPSMANKILAMLDLYIPGIKRLFLTRADLLMFFVKIVQESIRARDNKPLVRKDFIDFMVDLKRQGRVSKKKEHGLTEIEMDDKLIAAQALVFYFAGFDTSSTTMSYMLYELALNPDIQESLYNEICKVINKYNGEISYESLQDMTLLERILDETLRKYSVAGTLFRKCLKNYQLPGTDVVIEKDTVIFLPIHGLHYDKRYFSKPERFDPDRFTTENKGNLHPFSYLPFGDGPRNCIGKRFAKVQTMMGIVAFLKNFRVAPCKKTKVPLEYEPFGVTLSPLGGIHLNIMKR